MEKVPNELRDGFGTVARTFAEEFQRTRGEQKEESINISAPTPGKRPRRRGRKATTPIPMVQLDGMVEEPTGKGRERGSGVTTKAPTKKK